jgi:DNA polymerase
MGSSKARLRREFADILGQVGAYLRFLEEMGCTGFDDSSKLWEVPGTVREERTAISESLDEIRTELGDCRRCRLWEKRTRLVFGAGNPHAKLVFVGEGPGFEEDQQGEPFVGAAGRLLTKIIDAIQLSREQVYICNIVKCRPPGNRNPRPDEIEACLPFLERQIAAIQPDGICALGTVAAQTLLKSDAPISKLRGKVHFYQGIQVFPTYHPAYLLRNPGKKRAVWEDMQRLMKEMEKWKARKS